QRGQAHRFWHVCKIFPFRLGEQLADTAGFLNQRRVDAAWRPEARYYSFRIAVPRNARRISGTAFGIAVFLTTTHPAPTARRRIARMFKIFVGNLAVTTDADSIRELFSRHADVDDIALPINEATGKSRGFAIVMIKDEQQARYAM